MTSSAEYKNLESKYYMQVVNRMPPVLVRGEGTRVFDNDGNSYLDFTAGWAVLNLGHSHPAVTDAIRDQAGKILQMSNLFYTTPQLPLAKIIVDNSDSIEFSFATLVQRPTKVPVKLLENGAR
ncbi:MAG: hypothetical protein Ct9H300mP19_01290 [Dehalococcoidia bacterium]|nr:MAG: hypothetical protein Ct9H300mP19_01290 [Dehalococcoidia bacterium]